MISEKSLAVSFQVCSDKEVDLFARLATFFEKVKGLSQVRDGQNEVKRSITQPSEVGVARQDTKVVPFENKRKKVGRFYAFLLYC